MHESNPAGPAANGNPTIAKSGSSNAPTEAAELLRAEAGVVQAATVTMDRSGAERIAADRVTMDRSGANHMVVGSAQLDKSGVITLNSQHTVLHDGSAIAVIANEARLVNSRVLAVVSGDAQLERGTRVLLHIGQASGEARPVLDTAGAAALGAGLGLAVLVLGRVLRRLVS